MARRRYQRPTLKQTNTKDKSARRWYFDARVDVLIDQGKTARPQKRHYLGSVSEVGKREAEKKRDDILAQKINRPDVVLTGQVKFGAVLDRWLSTADVRDSTLVSYTSMVNAHLRPQWGHVAMSEITPMAVEDWLIEKSTTCTEKMYKNIRSRFNEVWKRAIFWRFTKDVCPTTGMQNLKRFGKPPRANTLPTLEQYHRFLCHLAEPFRSIVVVCTFTGLRISEAMALTVEQLDSEFAAITEAVNGRTGKIGPLKAKHSERTIPMRHMRQDTLVPADASPSDRPYNVGYWPVYLAIKKAAKETGIDYEGFGCHTFRRLHNTWFRRAAGGGAEATTLAMGQLGHGDARTNDGYYVEDAADAKRRATVAALMFSRAMEERVN